MQETLQQTVTDCNTYNHYPDIIYTAGFVNGSPIIVGRLLSVREVVSAIEKQHSLQEFINEYCITLSQVKQALQYCASRQCIDDKPAEFCHLCSLKRRQKGTLDVSDLEEITFSKMTYVRGKDSLFLGTLTELLEDWNGRDWWITAADLLMDYHDDLLEKE